MHRTTVMFPDALWQAMQRRSAEKGASISQFVREAVLAAIYAEASGKEATRLRKALTKAREDLR